MKVRLKLAQVVAVQHDGAGAEAPLFSQVGEIPRSRANERPLQWPASAVEPRDSQLNHLLDAHAGSLRGGAARVGSPPPRASHPVIYESLGVPRQVLDPSSASSPCELAETNQ